MGVINNFIVRTLIGIGEIKDTQCGFKLFTKEAAQIIFGNLHLVRWAFDVDMLYICKKRNIYIKEVPVTWEEVAGSKLMLLPATISFFRDYFAMLTFYNTGFWTYNREQSLISAN
jgi:dolichyl-phosphate beta-glucosyltransferase